MQKQLTEKEVLKKLDIPDFRHLTKDKVVSFASMVSQMDPAVAQKAIEQFPQFASVTLEALKDYKAVLDKALDKNSESANRCYDIYDKITDVLTKCLGDEDITFEEKKYYIEQLKEIARMAEARDVDNKKFNWGLIVTGGIAILSALGFAAAVLTNGKFEFNLPNKKV